MNKSFNLNPHLQINSKLHFTERTGCIFDLEFFESCVQLLLISVLSMTLEPGCWIQQTEGLHNMAQILDSLNMDVC